VLHSGIDILAMAGYPARAAADGQVVYTGYRTQWGYFAVLKHSGCATVYAHLLRLPQKQEYTQGEVFAYTGASGFVTGPHLHFEVRIGGKPMDNEEAIDGLWPDKIFYLDIEPHLALARLQNKEKDALEGQGLEFLQRVREGYEEIARTRGYIYMDATLPPEIIVKRILEEVKLQ